MYHAPDTINVATIQANRSIGYATADRTKIVIELWHDFDDLVGDASTNGFGHNFRHERV